MAKSAKDPRPAAHAPADVNDPGLASAPADAPAETLPAEEAAAAVPVDAAAEAPPAEGAPDALPVDAIVDAPPAETPQPEELAPDASAAPPAEDAAPADGAPANAAVEAPVGEAGAEAGAKAGAKAGAEAGAEAGAKAGAEAGAEAGARAGAEAGAEAPQAEEPPGEATAAPTEEAPTEAAPPFTISLPPLTEQALLYTAVSLDSASGLQVQMVLHMDRLPHRWQAVYSAPGPNPITYEQYMQMKAMHLELEQALVQVLRAASWQEPNAESWLAPWEGEASP